MITGRRIREKQAAEALGQPLPVPARPRPDVPWHQHEAELAGLRKAHAEEVGALRAENEELRTQLEQLTAPPERPRGKGKKR